MNPLLSMRYLIQGSARILFFVNIMYFKLFLLANKKLLLLLYVFQTGFTIGLCIWDFGQIQRKIRTESRPQKWNTYIYIYILFKRAGSRDEMWWGPYIWRTMNKTDAGWLLVKQHHRGWWNEKDWMMWVWRNVEWNLWQVKTGETSSKTYSDSNSFTMKPTWSDQDVNLGSQQ